MRFLKLPDLDWHHIPRMWAWPLIGVSAILATLVLGFVFPGLRGPAALIVVPTAAVLAYEARRMPWTRWELLLLAAVLVAGVVLFLISPSYIGRLF